MFNLRDGTQVDDPRLDRLASVTHEHIERYPLTAATLPAAPTPVVMGVNWYSNFDTPQMLRIHGDDYPIIGYGSLGRLRGGHATCLRPWTVRDTIGWWRYYDQGVEGRCVEFACLRMLSLYNRVRYDITSRWHYHQAQRQDEWAGGSYPGGEPHYEGTSVRAGLDVLQTYGAIRSRWFGRPIAPQDAAGRVDSREGIAVYRWATSWDDVRRTLGVPDWLPGVPMLNSWGTGYAKQVLLLDDAGDRILHEDGEFGAPTDR